MFILVNYRDSVEVRPYEFDRDLNELFIKKLNSKYIDKIIEDVGLVICVSEIIRHSKGIILRTKGAAIYKIDFKIAVFSPFKHQIIKGVICKSDINGIKISLGFYDDIVITPTEMGNSIFDDKTGLWSSENKKIIYNLGSEITIRIINILYNSNVGQNDEIPPMVVLVRQPNKGLINFRT